jgi:RNA polymerase sigma-70 factor (ECF subfamily)
MAEIPATRASLLVRLRDPKDSAAWREFVTLYTPLVYGYLRKQNLQHADAADLCQEVFSAVAGAIGRLAYDPQRGTFRGWLFTVMRRKLSNWRRTQRNRAEESSAAGQEFLEESLASREEEAQWEAEWEQRIFAWACAQVRSEVEEATWQAFWRSAIEGQPGQQVASDLGVSVAAVYHARSRIRARLKELVQSVQEP